MNTFVIYLGLFMVVFLTWCGLSAYVILDRLRHERRARSVEKVLAGLGKAPPVVLNAKARSRIVQPIIAQLPPPVVSQVAADMAAQRPVAEVFAEHAIERWGLANMYAVASGSTGADRWQRISALCILSLTKAECIHDLLLETMQNRDPDVASSAIVLLGRLQDARAAELLVLALRKNWHLSSFIARQLDAFRIPIDGLLVPLLDSPDPQVRYWAVTLLARARGGGRHDARIASLAEDPDPIVRKAVVQTLGMLGASRETLIVLRLLYDDVAFVRVHAVKALASFNQPEFAGSLRAMLGDPEWRVRLAAREALNSLEQSALAAPDNQYLDTSRFTTAGLRGLKDPVAQPRESRMEKMRRQPRPGTENP